MPEIPQSAGEAQPQLALSGFDRPGQRRPQVVVLALKALQPRRLLRPPELRLRLFGEGYEERRVPSPGLFRFPGLLEPFAPVLANGFQHPVARDACGRPGLRHHEGFVHERAQEIQDLTLAYALPFPHRLRGLQGPSSGED